MTADRDENADGLGGGGADNASQPNQFYAFCQALLGKVDRYYVSQVSILLLIWLIAFVTLLSISDSIIRLLATGAIACSFLGLVALGLMSAYLAISKEWRASKPKRSRKQ